MSATTEEAIPLLTLGWRLQMAMRHANLTALDMAGELEVSRDTVARWIHDETIPHRLFLQAWAARTGVNYGWLVGDGHPKASEGDTQEAKRAGRGLVTDNKDYVDPPKAVQQRSRRRASRPKTTAHHHQGRSLGGGGAESGSYPENSGHFSQSGKGYCRRHATVVDMVNPWQISLSEDLTAL